MRDIESYLRGVGIAARPEWLAWVDVIQAIDAEQLRMAAEDARARRDAERARHQ